MDQAALGLTFDPMTIEHLGSNMYSRLPNAVAELVANAYDADATEIRVNIHGRGRDQSIAVADNGHGMSRQDLADKYLRIGRNRRIANHQNLSESGRRHVSGKKGLGKLALFGIGQIIDVQTKRTGSAQGTQITLDWDDLRNAESATYEPAETSWDGETQTHGTIVTVRSLERKTDINARDLATSLSRLFNYVDASLSLIVIDRTGAEYPVDAGLRLSGVDAEFAWAIPDADVVESDALRAFGVEGKIVAAKKPLQTLLRGVTVYANGRLVNEPEFFGASDSSYAYAYLTGFVEIDSLDEIRPDVIATDRRAVNWDTPESAPFRDALRRMVEQIAQDRRRQRDHAAKKRLEQKAGIAPDSWAGTIKGPEKTSVDDLVHVLTSDDADMSEEVRDKAVASLKNIAPPYADIVWRQMHPEIQQAAFAAYKDERYTEAVLEAFKAYVALTRRLSGIKGGLESELFGKTYGRNANTKLKVLNAYDTTQLSQLTMDSVEEGQRELSKGVASAFRNPLSHETLTLVQEIGLFTYQDCLDALSVLSHLCRRAEGAVPSSGS